MIISLREVWGFRKGFWNRSQALALVGWCSLSLSNAKAAPRGLHVTTSSNDKLALLCSPDNIFPVAATAVHLHKLRERAKRAGA